MFTSTVAALAVLGLSANAQLIKTKPAFVDTVITTGKAVGNQMPIVGFGTWTIPNSQAGIDAVHRAVEIGYRHFDGATAYGNQVTVGKGLAQAFKANPNIKREELWVTTKIWATRHKDVGAAVDGALGQLGLNYVDLALVHFPVGNSNQPKKGPDGKVVLNAAGKEVTEVVAEYDFVAMWKLMEDAVASGKVKNIGISNFNVTQIDELLRSAKIKPHNHQIEAHPYLQDWKFYDYHQKVGIPIVAYAPFGNQNPEYHFRNWKSEGKLMLNDPVIKKIATDRGCTNGQVALAWNLARNVTVIPKAFNPQNAIDNYEARQTCKLTADDLTAIRALDKDGTAGKRYWEMCCVMRLPCYHGLQDAPVNGPSLPDYCEENKIPYNSERTDLWSTRKRVTWN